MSGDGGSLDSMLALGVSSDAIVVDLIILRSLRFFVLPVLWTLGGLWGNFWLDFMEFNCFL